MRGDYDKQGIVGGIWQLEINFGMLHFKNETNKKETYFSYTENRKLEKEK